jgi:hypothetical protein
MKIVKSREVLEYRENLKKKRELSSFDRTLKGLLSIPPPNKDK